MAATTQLMRQLVSQACAADDLPPAAPDDQSRDKRILFDKEVDGVRCTLIRTHSDEKAAVNLSPREQEIIRMIAKGYPNKTIADVLEISTWTVSTHLRRVFAKLKVNSRAAVVARSIGTGLLSEAPLAGRPPQPSDCRPL